MLKRFAKERLKSEKKSKFNLNDDDDDEEEEDNQLTHMGQSVAEIQVAKREIESWGIGHWGEGILLLMIPYRPFALYLLICSVTVIQSGKGEKGKRGKKEKPGCSASPAARAVGWRK